MPEADLTQDLTHPLPFEKCRIPGMRAVQPDVLRDAAQRLKIFGYIIASLSASLLIFYTIIPLLGGPRMGERFGLLDINMIVVMILALAVGVLARSERLKPQQMLDLGLLFVIFLSFSTGVVMKSGPGPLQIPSGYGVSEICVLIVFFPVIIPNSPWKILLTALIAASMDPLGVLLAVNSGKTIPPDANLYLAYFFNFLCIPLALVPSFVLNRLSRMVHDACEMGSYCLVECLGRGGMGEVWRAHHHLLARDAAVKLIRPEILGGNDPETRLAMTQRFEREAQATSKMKCPHTIDIFDYGFSAEGVCYYVMELLDGLDLESFVRKFGPVSPERAIHFLRQICESLAEAHENDLIHRDIKPANIYACRYGCRVDFVKVLDFGLVKTGLGTGDTDATLSAEHTTTGTPAFMAPEQVLGTHPVDGRTDIYAVGCVGYWLLTGQIVFTGQSAMEVMIHHAKTPPIPPSKLSELEIPKSLDGVILSCLEKDPGKRPPTAERLAEMLDACRLESSWTPQMAKEWWEIHIPKEVTDSSSGG